MPPLSSPQDIWGIPHVSLQESHICLSFLSFITNSSFNSLSLSTLMTKNSARWRTASSISGASICFSSVSSSFYLLPIHLCTITQSHTCGHTLGIYELQFPPTPITPLPSHPGVSGEWRCCFSGWHTPLHIWNADKETLSMTYTESITSGFLVLWWLMHHSFKVKVQDMSMDRQLTWIHILDHNT